MTSLQTPQLPTAPMSLNAQCKYPSRHPYVLKVRRPRSSVASRTSSLASNAPGIRSRTVRVDRTQHRGKHLYSVSWCDAQM